MTDSLDSFLSNYPPEMQAISRKLRAMVKSVMPQAHESFYKIYVINYSSTPSMGDRVCYIAPMKDYVRLGFMRGTQLPDPDHRLVGEGKWLRHVKVKTLKEAGHPALKRLVKTAWVYAQATMKAKTKKPRK